MNLSAEAAERRGGFGEERYEVSDFQRAVRGRFAELQAAVSAASPGAWQDIDADGTVEAIHERIVQLCNARELWVRGAHAAAGSAPELPLGSAAAPPAAAVGAHAGEAAGKPRPVLRLWDGAPL